MLRNIWIFLSRNLLFKPSKHIHICFSNKTVINDHFQPWSKPLKVEYGISISIDDQLIHLVGYELEPLHSDFFEIEQEMQNRFNYDLNKIHLYHSTGDEIFMVKRLLGQI